MKIICGLLNKVAREFSDDAFDINIQGQASSNGGWDMEGVLNKVNTNTIYKEIYSQFISNKWVNQEVYRSNNYGIYGSPSDKISSFSSIPNQGTDYVIWRLFTPYDNANYLLASVPVRSGPLTGPHLWLTKNALETVPTQVVWEELPVTTSNADWYITTVNFDYNNPNIIYVAYGKPANDNSSAGLIYKVDYSIYFNTHIPGDIITEEILLIIYLGYLQELMP